MLNKGACPRGRRPASRAMDGVDDGVGNEMGTESILKVWRVLMGDAKDSEELSASDLAQRKGGSLSGVDPEAVEWLRERISRVPGGAVNFSEFCDIVGPLFGGDAPARDEQVLPAADPTASGSPGRPVRLGGDNDDAGSEAGDSFASSGAGSRQNSFAEPVDHEVGLPAVSAERVWEQRTAALKKCNVELLKRCSEQDDAIADLRGKLTSDRRRFQEVSSQLERARSQLGQLESRTRSLQAENESLARQLRRARAAPQPTAVTPPSSNKEDLQEAKRARERLEAEASRLRLDRRELDERRRALESEHSSRAKELAREKRRYIDEQIKYERFSQELRTERKSLYELRVQVENERTMLQERLVALLKRSASAESQTLLSDMSDEASAPRDRASASRKKAPPRSSFLVSSTRIATSRSGRDKATKEKKKGGILSFFFGRR